MKWRGVNKKKHYEINYQTYVAMRGDVYYKILV